MTKKTVCLVLLMYLTIHSAFSQQSLTYTSQFVDYQKALTLYNNSQFLAAQSVFNQVKSKTSDEVLQSDCAYYIANCAVRLNQKNADDLIQGFVEEYLEMATVLIIPISSRTAITSIIVKPLFSFR